MVWARECGIKIQNPITYPRITEHLITKGLSKQKATTFYPIYQMDFTSLEKSPAINTKF